MSAPDELVADTAPFVDAVVGLASVCRRVDRMIEDGTLAALVASHPELLDAAIGACSLHAMVHRVIAAMAETTALDAPEPAATWRRDHLR